MCAETWGLETTVSTVLEDSVELRRRAGDAEMLLSTGVYTSADPSPSTCWPWREDADDRGGVGYEGSAESPCSWESSGGP